MSSRLHRLNGVIRPSGFQLAHSSTDPVIRELDSIRNRLRLQTPDSLQWCEEASRLASLAHLRRLLDAHDFSLVIDVGANVGQFASSLRGLGYHGRIVSFEPNPTVLAALESAAAEDPDWIVIPGGVGARMETLVLHDTEDSSFASLLKPNEASGQRFGSLVESRKGHQISVRPLPLWLEEQDIDASGRIFLKSDTQGFDLAVLEGCGSILEKIEAILVELSYQPLYEGAPTHRDIEAFLENSGFVLSGSYPISYYPEDLRLIEADGFFVRPPSA